MPRRPSRQPREWLKNQRSFGGEGRPEWLVGEVRSRTDALMLQTAQLQHAIVLTLHRMEPEVSWQQVAEGLGAISYQQLRKIISGQAHMSMRDLVLLSDYFGPLLILSQQVREEIGARPNGWLFPTRKGDTG